MANVISPQRILNEAIRLLDHLGGLTQGLISEDVSEEVENNTRELELLVRGLNKANIINLDCPND